MPSFVQARNALGVGLAIAAVGGVVEVGKHLTGNATKQQPLESLSKPIQTSQIPSHWPQWPQPDIKTTRHSSPANPPPQVGADVSVAPAMRVEICTLTQPPICTSHWVPSAQIYGQPQAPTITVHKIPTTQPQAPTMTHEPSTQPPPPYRRTQPPYQAPTTQPPPPYSQQPSYPTPPPSYPQQPSYPPPPTQPPKWSYQRPYQAPAAQPTYPQQQPSYPQPPTQPPQPALGKYYYYYFKRLYYECYFSIYHYYFCSDVNRRNNRIGNAMRK